MNKFCYIIFLVLLPAVLLSAGFSLTFSENYILPRDPNFKEVYGNGMLCSEIKLSHSFYGDYYVWGSYGIVKKTGETQPYFHMKTSITQNYFSGGLGFTEDFAKNLGYKLEIGFTVTKYREKAFGIESSGEGLGFRGETGLVYKFSNKFFSELSIGYMNGTEKHNFSTLKLGGIKVGVSIGAKF